MPGTKPLYRIWRCQYIVRYQYELNQILNAKLRTPDAERRTPDAKLQTPDAELQTPDAKPLADTFYSDAGRQMPPLLERASPRILIR